MSDRIPVAVAWCLPEKQVVIRLEVPADSTVAEVIEQSGIRARCGDAEIDPTRVGVFGRLASPDQKVRAGDRIEIYRPLRIDPKDARRLRARQAE